MSCYFCDEPLDPKTCYARIEGWERQAGTRPSGSHGGSDIYLRRRTGEAACEACITKLRNGVPTGQRTLV